MFLCGGIPDVYHESFRRRARKEMTGHYFASRPLRAESSREYVITEQHLDELFETLTAEADAHPSCFDDGLGVIFLLRPWEQGYGLIESFFPFALCNLVPTSDRPVRRGSEARRIANNQIADIFAAARNLIEPCRVVTSDLRSRERRTPLLLPIRHFDASSFSELLGNLSANLKDERNPKQYLHDQCAEFERSFPFKRKNRTTSHFVNDEGVSFVATRVPHGQRWAANDASHDAECYFNASLRLGGGTSASAHYDCTRGRGPYKGTFKNCHDQEDDYTGKPHLNVYSNDFIR